MKSGNLVGCLAYAVSDVFHSVVANRRQPSKGLGARGGGGYALSRLFTIWHFYEILPKEKRNGCAKM